MVRFVKSEAAFAMPGFSPAVCLPSGLVLVSGQVAVGADGKVLGKGDFDAQTEMTMQNLEAVLVSLGATLRNIVRLGIIVTDRAYVPRWRELRGKYFSDPFPASTMIIAGLVSEDFLVEIEATAYMSTSTLSA
jgi:2-iminobutanoate/2-iminopropanoate deaminase